MREVGRGGQKKIERKAAGRAGLVGDVERGRVRNELMERG